LRCAFGDIANLYEPWFEDDDDDDDVDVDAPLRA
jgi:hypothetical protein